MTVELAGLDQLRGVQLPRIGTPRRPDLATFGPAATALYEVLGVDLLEWQQTTLNVGMEVLPSGLFRSQTVTWVVARQNGKTRGVMVPRIAAQLFLLPKQQARRGQRMASVLHTAADRAVPRSHFEELAELITGVPELSREVKRLRLANGQEELTLRNGKSYRILAPTAQAFRGWTCELLCWDEIREQRDTDAFSAALYTQRAVPNPQMWGTSNAGDPDSTILNRLRDRGRAAAADPDSDPGMTYLEWSADDAKAITDTSGWEQANPSLGYILRPSALVEELQLDDPDRFRTEALCQWVDSTTRLAVPPDRWRACAEGVPEREDSAATWLAVDIDPEQTRGVLVAVAWHSGRLVAELLESWDTGAPVSEQAVADRVLDWWRALRARGVAFDPYTSKGVADRLRVRVPKEQLHGISGVDWYTACGQLWDVVQALTLWHADDPRLSGDVLAAARREVGDGAWSMSRKHSQQSIPGATALARAVHLAVTPQPVPRVH